jgi:hypothetical protein
MPLIQTRGAASAQGFGEFAQAAVAANYIEEVFSTYLYTGTGAALTITNNIDLSTKGGLVWIKSRSGSFGHRLTDTARGATKELVSNAVTIEATVANGLTAFNSTGFALGSDTSFNNNTSTYASWTFRKQPKFFDVVTYTGNSVSGRAIPHNLGSTPGCVIIKAIDQTENWAVWHRSGSQNNTDGAFLNTTATYSNKSIALWGANPGTPDMNATTFSVGGNAINNGSGSPYVAYLFAHDAGGFGLTGTDNVISCGSFTTDGSGLATVSLGYEPQWVLFKQTDGADSWYLNDIMRGMSVSAYSNNLSPNSSAAESAGGYDTKPTATGFNANSGIANKNYIYIAIRRGPMKVPTVGTSVFTPAARSGTGAIATVTGVGFPPDLYFSQPRQSNSNPVLTDRLRGATKSLSSRGTFAEQTETGSVTAFGQDGVTLGANDTDFFGGVNQSGFTYANWNFRRAPSFFDEVCYTGTGSNLTLPHNLTVAPELIIAKVRSTGSSWGVSTSADWTKYLLLNSTNAQASASLFGTPDATNFYPSASGGFSGSGNTYVAYLFATCAGVSKVGSYTGNGTTQTINCGFTSGARFVLIKRTDSTGDWYVWDSTRGIVAGNDPHLSLNTTAAEITTDDSVDTDSTGFVVNQVAATDINVSAATYIFLAIA